jgi:glutamine---fructose-6-phosphate transaminase (isomerizing)
VESPGPTLADTRQLAARLHHSGCQVRQLADGTDRLPDATSSILFNSRLPEALTPLSLAVAAQLLAYHLALARGRDPDRPRSLKKVTQTW